MKKYLLIVMALLCSAVTMFAQAPNTWTQKADFGGGVKSSATDFSVGGKGYVGTGWDGQNNTKDFWEYDPGTNKWTRKADFPGAARVGATGFSIGNKGYIGGGEDDYYGPYYADFWEYDPAADKWTRIADFPGPIRNLAAGFSIGNKGYYGLGFTANTGDVFYSDFWEYDPTIDKWTRKADYGGGGRNGAGSFSIGNKGYVGCGFNWDYGGWTKDFWEYDPTTDRWTRKADFGGSAREYISTVGFSIGKKGYLGTGYPERLKDFWEYDPDMNSWTRKADLGGPARAGATGFSIGNKGYIGCGDDYPTYFKDFWEYTPDVVTGCIPPSGLTVVNLTDSSAKLGWTLPGSTINGFMIRYAPAGTNQVRERLATTTSTHVTLKNLLQNTTYKWKIRSVCAEDVSAWVAGTDFTTASSFVKFQGTINISPNPVTGNVLNLHLTNINTTNVQLIIIDVQGRIYIKQMLMPANSVLNKEIDVAILPKGIYTLKVIDNKNEQQQVKFVKTN